MGCTEALVRARLAGSCRPSRAARGRTLPLPGIIFAPPEVVRAMPCSKANSPASCLHQLHTRREAAGAATTPCNPVRLRLQRQHQPHALRAQPWHARAPPVVFNVANHAKDTRGARPLPPCRRVAAAMQMPCKAPPARRLCYVGHTLQSMRYADACNPLMLLVPWPWAWLDAWRGHRGATVLPRHVHIGSTAPAPAAPAVMPSSRQYHGRAQRRPLTTLPQSQPWASSMSM